MKMRYEFEVEIEDHRVFERGGSLYLEIRCNEEEIIQIKLPSKKYTAVLGEVLSEAGRDGRKSTVTGPIADVYRMPNGKKELKPGQLSMESVLLDALRGKDKMSFSDLQNALVKAGYARGSAGMALTKLKIANQVEQVSYGVYRLKRVVNAPA